MCYSIKPATKLKQLAEEHGLNPIKGKVEDFYAPTDILSGFEFPFVPVVTNDDKIQSDSYRLRLVQCSLPYHHCVVHQ